MSDFNETKPNLQPVTQRDSVDAPPRLLLIGVIGLFILVVASPFAGIFVFQEVLSPAQRQRVIDTAPFMDRFLKPTPQGGAVPTLEAVDNNDAMNLLNLNIGSGETPEATSEATSESTAETDATEVSFIMPSPTPMATALPPTATQQPTATPTTPVVIMPTPTTASTVLVSQSTASQLPASARLYGMRWARQEWNNCGPATMTIALSFYGWQENQKYAASYLKPNREDKNVSPSELTQFINDRTGVKAMMRMGGNIRVLKALLANNFPVIVERGIMFEGNDWLGHYQALVGYDDTQQVFYAFDSFLGNGDADQGVIETYTKLDEDWRHFNRTFIVIYQAQDEYRVQEILGDLATSEGAAEVAFETAQAEALKDREDPFAWFNMGTSLVALERYNEAANAFDQSRRTSKTLPWRMLWYQFGPFEAYFNTGRYDDILSLAQSNLNMSEELEESYYWRGKVYVAQGKFNQAASEFRIALRYNPNFEAAKIALDSL